MNANRMTHEQILAEAVRLNDEQLGCLTAEQIRRTADGWNLTDEADANDWTLAEAGAWLLDVARADAKEQAAEDEAAKADANGDRVWRAIDAALASRGLVVCGLSGKSASRYYGRDRDDSGYDRIRVSDHSVAHACSDCAVCIEVGHGSPDADVIVELSLDDAAIERAIAEAVAIFQVRASGESRQ
jgi:hypothetical protein